MIVCLCKGVSCKQIRDEARRGNRTVSQIAKACQAGTGCGMCLGQIRELLDGSPGARHENNELVSLRR